MSATTSPVVSPRKGKHARSGGLTFTQPAVATSASASSRNDAAAASTSSFSSFGPTALPWGLDPLTLDAEEAFVKFSVREVQSMEANLQLSHDQLSSSLKGLVSDRYRDMLGTANTLIEMSTSATNLVKRLDSVRKGVVVVEEERANGREAGDEKKAVSPFDEIAMTTTTPSNGDREGAEEDEGKNSNVLAIAAATKLLVEAPDELWRAIESASYHTSSTNAAKQRDSLAPSWREWSDYKAASAMKAAWIFVLCERAWNWLSNEVETTSLFPYVSKQWASMIPFKEEIVRVSRSGLAGWYSPSSYSEKSTTDTRWEDMSSTYISTLTFTLAMALLDKQSLISSRDALLSERRKAIEDHLTKPAKNSASTTIARTIRSIADTVIHCLQAFHVSDGRSKGLSLARLFDSVASPTEAYGSFPPHAKQALIALPTGEMFVDHLPTEVKMYAPALSCKDAQKCQSTTLSALREWCEEIRTSGRESFFKSGVERIDTISGVGEAQIQIRRDLDRSVTLLRKVNIDTEARNAMEEELRAFAEMLESSLLERVDVLCRQRTAELSLAVCESTTAALGVLKRGKGQSSTSAKESQREEEMERTPIRFVLESDFSISDVKGKLRLQTPLVKQVLTSVEEKARTLATEIESYSAFVERDASRRRKRKQRRNEQDGDRINHDSSSIEEQVGKVLESYRTAFDGARLALVDELRSQLGSGEEDPFGDDGQAAAVQRLLVARIASALQRSNVLRSATTVAAKSNDAIFLQRLANLRAQVVNEWVTQMVKEAVLSYTTSLLNDSVESLGGGGGGGGGEEEEEEEEGKVGRPTTALAAALLKLVDGIDATGCGHQSEASALGRQVLSEFISAWVQIGKSTKDDQQRECHQSDSLLLLTLVREYGDEAKKEADQLTGLLGGKDALASQPQSSSIIEAGIQRLRLVLHPLRCPEVIRTAERKKTTTPSDVAAPPPCPPLPMVKLISARNRVPLF